mmetsp:Transcript_65374/g.141232  ORF Transcript_65374/g.141232 Transcript_65374/m.141232 type:complete len:106 (+) Transcript_65374:37-354(+)
MGRLTPEERRPGSTWTKFKRMWMEKPLIPIGCMITTGFLLNGLHSMRTGQKVKSQWMMRGRVAAQAATILSIALYYGWFTTQKPQEIPDYTHTPQVETQEEDTAR